MQVEIVLDLPVAEARSRMSAEGSGKRFLANSGHDGSSRPRSELKAIKKEVYQNCVLRELESGTIEMERDGLPLLPVKPHLRELAAALNVPLLNMNGNAFNTRQLGSQIIRTLEELNGTKTPNKPAKGL